MDFDVLKRVLAALESRRVRYVIFGAVALNLHGLARSAEDVDLFVDPEESNIERLKLALKMRSTIPTSNRSLPLICSGRTPLCSILPRAGRFTSTS